MLLEKIFSESIRFIDTWPNAGVNFDGLIFPTARFFLDATLPKRRRQLETGLVMLPPPGE